MSKPGSYLLDTNIAIELMRGESALLERVRVAQDIFISSISLGELYHGAYKSCRTAENLARVADFAAHNTVLAIDSETAQQYGIIRHRLHKKGFPIPENDVWIAALALQHGIILVTRDLHFQQVAGLPKEAW